MSVHMEDAVSALKRWPDAPRASVMIDAVPLLRWLDGLSRHYWHGAHDPALSDDERAACCWKAEAYDAAWREVRRTALVAVEDGAR